MRNEDWIQSRKSFLRTLILGGVALQMPWLQACSDEADDIIDTSPLSQSQFKNLRAVLDALFPEDDDGPGALEVNADLYLLWILNDPLLDPDENQYIIDRLDQFIVKCRSAYKMEFHELSVETKYKFIAETSQSPRGKSWLSRLLTIIFEALFLDPIYGGNTNQMAWEWLEHNPGAPRPNNRLKYPDIQQIGYEI